MHHESGRLWVRADVYGVITADVYGGLRGQIWGERDGYGRKRDSSGEMEDAYGRRTQNPREISRRLACLQGLAHFEWSGLALHGGRLWGVCRTFMGRGVR